MNKNFKKNIPSKYWYITVNDSFFTNNNKQLLSPNRKDAFHFFNEDKCKDIFNELNKRYSVVGAVVKLNFFEKEKPKSPPKKEKVEKVFKKKITINKST